MTITAMVLPGEIWTVASMVRETMFWDVVLAMASANGVELQILYAGNEPVLREIWLGPYPTKFAIRGPGVTVGLPLEAKFANHSREEAFAAVTLLGAAI